MTATSRSRDIRVNTSVRGLQQTADSPLPSIRMVRSDEEIVRDTLAAGTGR